MRLPILNPPSLFRRKTVKDDAMAGLVDSLEPMEAGTLSLRKVTDAWNDSLDRFQVQTPSPEMNSLVNIHNARQCRITANWSRYLSLYQLGLGARGMGFRDTSQDVMGIDKSELRHNVLDAGAVTFIADGIESKFTLFI